MANLYLVDKFGLGPDMTATLHRLHQTYCPRDVWANINRRGQNSGCRGTCWPRRMPAGLIPMFRAAVPLPLEHGVKWGSGATLRVLLDRNLEGQVFPKVLCYYSVRAPYKGWREMALHIFAHELTHAIDEKTELTEREVELLSLYMLRENGIVVENPILVTNYGRTLTPIKLAERSYKEQFAFLMEHRREYAAEKKSRMVGGWN